MSEVCAPRYLAGLSCTHEYLRSERLCQTPLNRGDAYPVRTWLSSWNRAIHAYIQCPHHSANVQLLQMYLTSPQDNITITAPYNVTVVSTGPLTEAQPWVWSASVTPNGEV